MYGSFSSDIWTLTEVMKHTLNRPKRTGNRKTSAVPTACNPRPWDNKLVTVREVDPKENLARMGLWLYGEEMILR